MLVPMRGVWCLVVCLLASHVSANTCNTPGTVAGSRGASGLYPFQWEFKADIKSVKDSLQRSTGQGYTHTHSANYAAPAPWGVTRASDFFRSVKNHVFSYSGHDPGVTLELFDMSVEGRAEYVKRRNLLKQQYSTPELSFGTMTDDLGISYLTIVMEDDSLAAYLPALDRSICFLGQCFSNEIFPFFKNRGAGAVGYFGECANVDAFRDAEYQTLQC